MATVFDRILSGELPSATIYEDERIYVFMDAFPQTLGHCLIIPKRAQPDLFTMPDDDLAYIIQFSKKLAHALRKALSPDGIRVMQFNGEAAGQSVFHYHMHLIPMWHEQKMGGHGDKAVALEALQATADKIIEVLDV
ncbi:HIT family protein [Suttonella sp. R2A3]|uniref:HIT family protein n=1 Tax=Suttonella sp. R2A3 TaxID=2908648 RepID=UPI001F2FACA1|nr:HIT family protein [Suttonella sp. R2A3]UJF24571.1 HIT family protein [Suttonella sp. R2A3]